MNIFKEKMRETLGSRAINRAIRKTKPENFKIGDLVVHIDDTSQVFEIQTFNRVLATLAPYEDNIVDKETIITLPLIELVGINDIIRNFIISLDDFNKTQGKKIALC